MNKLPQLTLLFWIMKICATTLGETAGDLFSMTLGIGYAASSLILLFIFIVILIWQLISKSYIPAVYWLVILATSTVGTTISDFMDRTMKLGYPTGSLILVLLLCAILFFWKVKEKSLSVDKISTRSGEIFYWTSILCSNTLGTALGDFLADSSGLGFFGGALLITFLLTLILLAYYFTKISHVFLFWSAFVLTRPFGATFGDLLTKPHTNGGLGFGTVGSSMVLFAILLITIIYSSNTKNA